MFGFYCVIGGSCFLCVEIIVAGGMVHKDSAKIVPFLNQFVGGMSNKCHTSGKQLSFCLLSGSRSFVIRAANSFQEDVDGYDAWVFLFLVRLSWFEVCHTWL
jgi:hypothetical protein